ncbi:MAG: hypothetical protein ACR2K1_08600, partial [Saprospiraceae bacterium]
PSSGRYNDYIQIKSRFNSLQRELLLGGISNEEFNKTRNNISAALLLLADDLREDDLAAESKPTATAGPKRGELLYHIPDLMETGREEKCTVRIAWVLEQLLRDWNKKEADVVKNIRISDVMSVELLIAEAGNPFEIRSLSEKVQFIDQYDFTEWIFYVKPIMEGQFTLALRVSVIEMINDKEYKKDIVLEEEVLVKTEAPAAAAKGFKKAPDGIALGGGVLENANSRGMDFYAESYEPESAAESEPPTPPTPAPAPKPAYPGGGNALKMMMILVIGSAGLALAYFGVWSYGGADAAGDYEKGFADVVAVDTAQIADIGEAASPEIDSLRILPDQSGNNTAPAPERRPASRPEDQIAKEYRNPKRPRVRPDNPDLWNAKGEGAGAGVAVTRLRGKQEFFLNLEPFMPAAQTDTGLTLQFLKYNEFGDVQIRFRTEADWRPAPGQVMELLGANDKKVLAPIRYGQSESDQQTEGFFTIGPEVLNLLCDTEIRSLALAGPDGASFLIALSPREQKILQEKARGAAAAVRARKSE